MKKIFIIFGLCFCLLSTLFMLSACGSNRITVESITFSQDVYEIFKGGSKKLEINLLPEDARGFSLQWKTSNPKLLSVDLGGYAQTYDLYGEATVTVTEKYSGVSASCKVIVNDGYAFKIYADYSNIKTTYYEGESFDSQGLTVYASYQSGVDKVIPASQYEIDVPDVLTNDTKVKINYNDLSTEFDIYVVKDHILGLTVLSQPIKTTYLLGESFDPTGLEIGLLYASGKIENIYDYEYDNSPLEYGTESIVIKYLDYEIEIPIKLKTNYVINNISNIQSVIDNAENGTSIMISKGEFNVFEPIRIPKSKNLTILGENSDVIINSIDSSIFEIVNDTEESCYLKIFNITLNSTNTEKAIFSLNNIDSINNLNNIEISLSQITFEINTNGKIIEFISNKEFTTQYIENIDLSLNNCILLSSTTSESENNNIIHISGINNGILNITECDFNNSNNIIFIEDSYNFDINISNTILNTISKVVVLNEIKDCNINIFNNSYLKGLSCIDVSNSENIELKIDNSYLTSNQNQEDILENITAILFLKGCKNLNITINNSNLTTMYKDEQIYENALNYISIIKDNDINSKNNEIILKNCDIVCNLSEIYLIIENNITSFVTIC